jgi:hypothetical protein
MNLILLEIIRTKAGDPDFDQKQILDQNYMVINANFENFDIGEFSQLAGIWRQLGSGSVVSPNRIGNEVDGVLGTLRKGLEKTKPIGSTDNNLDAGEGRRMVLLVI